MTNNAIVLTDNAIVLTDNAIALTNNRIVSTDNAIVLTNNAIALTDNAIEMRTWNIAQESITYVYTRSACQKKSGGYIFYTQGYYCEKVCYK